MFILWLRAHGFDLHFDATKMHFFSRANKKKTRDEHTCLHNEEYVCGLVIAIRHGVPDATQTWVTNGWARTEGGGYYLEAVTRPAMIECLFIMSIDVISITTYQMKNILHTNLLAVRCEEGEPGEIPLPSLRIIFLLMTRPLRFLILPQWAKVLKLRVFPCHTRPTWGFLKCNTYRHQQL